MARNSHLRAVATPESEPAAYDSPQRAVLAVAIAEMRQANDRVEEATLGLDRARGRIREMRKQVAAAEAAVTDATENAGARVLADALLGNGEPSSRDKIAAANHALAIAQTDLEAAREAVTIIEAELKRREESRGFKHDKLEAAAIAVEVMTVNRLVASLAEAQTEWRRQWIVLRSIVNRGWEKHRIELGAANALLSEGIESNSEVWNQHPARQPWDEYHAALKQDANAKAPE